MAVIGGLGSLAGAVTGALWVVGLPLFWPKNETVPLLTSSIGLLIVLLYIPGGFTQLGYALRGMILRWLEKRLPERPAKTVTAPPVSLSARAGRARSPRTTTAARCAPSRSASTSAVSSRSTTSTSTPMPGEVIGLIGTNGAGKSTLLNAIGGYVPSRGHGRAPRHGRVRDSPPHLRARAGLGRTFQAATLFPELTVRETVQLALEARGRTSFWGSLLFYPPSIAKERTKRAEAAELIDFLGLGRYADRFIAELSTGTRRIVELDVDARGAPARRLPRRADRRCRAARGRGVRTAHQADPARARRDAHRRRARPPAHHVDQRPHLLPRGRRGDRGRRRPRRCATTRSSSRRTSAPTTARSSVRTPTDPRDACSVRRPPTRSRQAPETFCTGVTCVQSPAAPIVGSYATRP